MFSSEATSAFLGLLSAATWGAGDFCGGLAARRSSAFSVVVASQIIGLMLLALAALLLGEPWPPLSDWLWGAGAGLAGVIGLLALYRALAEGQMGLTAPVSAVVAASLPVIVGMLTEGWPSVWQGVGFALALLAVWCISATGQLVAFNLEQLRLPLLAGLGFGLFFVVLDRASGVAVLWTLCAARIASISVMLAIALSTRRAWWTEAGQWGLLALSGAFDAGGNAFYALAAQIGRMDIAAVLSSLYPASTVVLAWLILKERLSRVQMMGIVVALIAIMLITG